MCIGATFAMMEIKIVLAMLLQRYRLVLEPGARIDRAGIVTIAPKHSMPMRVLCQDKRFPEVVGQVRGNIHDIVALPGKR
jgi:hypothetical protein